MSMWKKIKKLIVPTSDETENDDSDMEFVSFQTKEPIDVLFTKNFIAGGGHFFYCETEQEALENLKDIIENEQIEKMNCFDDNLKSYLNRLNVKHHSSVHDQADFSFIECEYLAAYDGTIMVSTHQTNGRMLSTLPPNFIVFASPKQLVSNISEGMQKIKSVKSDNIPSISSLRGKKMHDFDSSANSKNIYLLLVEQF
ncbi:LUD domain-containing protein [Moheibacter sp.]|uniref:LUD domain-containing protein n=1 Tax=Moheibacter sp. TaxID=1965316 RepID=UPI003C791DA4